MNNEIQKLKVVVFTLFLIAIGISSYKMPLSVFPASILFIISVISNYRLYSFFIFLLSFASLSIIKYILGDSFELFLNFYTHNFSYKYLTFNYLIEFFGKNDIKTIFNYLIIPMVSGGFFIYPLLEIVRFVLHRDDGRKKLLSAKRKDAKKIDFSKVKHDLKNQYVPLGVELWGNGKTPIGIPHQLLNRHVCLVGTTGSGKTVTLYHFLINAALFGKPIVFVDGKGDQGNIQKFQNMCAHFGKTCRVVTLDGQTGFNPFATGTPTELTDKIINMFDWSEEHYRLTSARFVQLLLQYMRLQGIPCNLNNLVKYSNLKVLSAFHIAHNNVPETQPLRDPAAAQAVVDSASQDGPSFNVPPVPQVGRPSFNSTVVDPGKQLTPADELFEKLRSCDQKAIQGIQARMATMAEGDMAEMFSAEEALDLSSAIEGGEAVLFSLDSLRYPGQAKALGRLVINDIKNCVSKHARNGSAPVGLFFDEFNVFASHEVVDIVNKARSAGFEAVIAFQSLSDIDKLESGEPLRRQIIQNCNCLIVQLQNDSHDAEELASLFGTETAVAETIQVDELEGATGMQSLRRVQEFVVHPDEIKRLKVGQAFVKISGLGSTKVQIMPN